MPKRLSSRCICTVKYITSLSGIVWLLWPNAACLRVASLSLLHTAVRRARHVLAYWRAQTEWWGDWDGHLCDVALMTSNWLIWYSSWPTCRELSALQCRDFTRTYCTHLSIHLCIFINKMSVETPTYISRPLIRTVTCIIFHIHVWRFFEWHGLSPGHWLLLQPDWDLDVQYDDDVSDGFWK